MKLLTPSQVCKIFDHIFKPIQVTDLDNKGVIRAYQETSGQGTARLFDEKGVFDAAVAISLRGILSPNFVARTIKKIHDYLKEDKPWDLMVIDYSERKGQADWRVYSFEAIDASAFRPQVGASDPREYRTVVLNITDLKNFIKSRM
jgi:hypothetical protein